MIILVKNKGLCIGMAGLPFLKKSFKNFHVSASPKVKIEAKTFIEPGANIKNKKL